MCPTKYYLSYRLLKFSINVFQSDSRSPLDESCWEATYFRSLKTAEDPLKGRGQDLGKESNQQSPNNQEGSRSPSPSSLNQQRTNLPSKTNTTNQHVNELMAGYGF